MLGFIKKWLRRDTEWNVNYTEGTWFAVPLPGGGFAAGVVARAKAPALLGYFFGPKRETLPRFEDVSGLAASHALKVIRCSDLHLIEGVWRILGRDESFRRSDWPFPKFVRTEPITNRTWLIECDEDDPLNEISKSRIPFGSSKLDPAVFAGAEAVEIALAQSLGLTGVVLEDAIALKHLRTDPDDNRPHPFRHFMYVPNRAKSKRLEQQLRNEGFTVESRTGASGKDWLVLAHHSMIPDEAKLDSLGEHLSELAEAAGGEYDGWEADAEPDVT